MAEIEVPPYFVCPISLEIMKDPVTVSTGITYDRDSIEKWIFSQNNNTCPVTMQALFDPELIPNITLRRLIQSWCTVHASQDIEKLPTPKSPVCKSQILKLITDADDAAASPQRQMECLKRLKSIASQNQTNRRSMETVGTAEFLASLIMNKTLETSRAEVFEDSSELTRVSHESLSILYSLQLSESGLKSLNNTGLIESLTRVMQTGSYESRACAIMLLKSMLEVAEPDQLIHLSPKFFTQLTQILRDQISEKATKSSLKALAISCPWGRNRIKAVNAGAVPLLIDLLLNSSDKRASEMILTVLETLCQIAEGRSELLQHGAGLAIVSKKILRVSNGASERAVKILHSICKFSATHRILQEMLQIGVVNKLCLVLQVDCGSKSKDRAREILKLHARAWRNASCIPSNLNFSYPN
ncbi:E3 ubiquitin-protein ligase PUB23-like [Primulina tabacum]|uniref:E3 ubiquitin-protein ligase PUB23-like n=1 Tax=Primulina tabacum TaxID=48773 RepID=UPI003F5A55DF